MLSFEEFEISKYTRKALDDCSEVNSFVLTFESLDKPEKVLYLPPKNVDGSTFIRGEFKIRDFVYNIGLEVLDATKNAGKIYLGLNFSRDDGVFSNTGDLTKKEALSVFATVANETNKFIELYKPDVVFFSTNDIRKWKLYCTLLRTRIENPNYVIEEVESVLSIIIHKKSINMEDNKQTLIAKAKQFTNI